VRLQPLAPVQLQPPAPVPLLVLVLVWQREPRGWPVASLVAIVGAGYVLVHAGDVVEGAVAAGLAEYYAQMDAAVAKIDRWYDTTRLALYKVQDLMFAYQSIVSANSELRAAMRPLHEAVREAALIIDRARFEMQAIDNLIRRDVEQLNQEEFANINSLGSVVN
jgi:hypothetical protein